jgi:5'-nucleotidase (lipoprotein e(P4) family)
MQRTVKLGRGIMMAGIALLMKAAGGAGAQDSEPAPNDNLNAVLWTQRSVEFKGNALGAYALARMRLDEALADPTHTAAPAEQTGDFKDLPPAVILDVDETVLDTSLYQAWTVVDGQSFSPKTWTPFVNSKTSRPIPGAVEFTRYADGKGVKVFYVTNRTAEEEPATRENMAALGFPMGGNVDTLLTAKEQPDWGSAKSTRRAAIAKDYRILLLVGDNLGDFSDGYKGDEAARLKVYEENADRWGKDWIVIANPTYGSFESAPYGHDYKLPAGAQRAAKEKVLEAWPGP